MDGSEKPSPALTRLPREMKFVLSDRSQSLIAELAGEFANCEHQLLLT